MAYQIMCMIIKTSRGGACEGYWLTLSSIDTIYLAIGNFIIVAVFLCSVFNYVPSYCGYQYFTCDSSVY